MLGNAHLIKNSIEKIMLTALKLHVERIIKQFWL